MIVHYNLEINQLKEPNMAITFNNEKLDKHRELADAIKSGLETNGSNIVEKEGHGAYYANLPEGVDKKQVEAVAKYNNNFVLASHIAIGETAADMFKKDKSLERVDAEVGFFGKRDKIQTTVHREKTYTNSMAKTPEEATITKHLVMTPKIETGGYGLKGIRAALSEEFKNSL